MIRNLQDDEMPKARADDDVARKKFEQTLLVLAELTTQTDQIEILSRLGLYIFSRQLGDWRSDRPDPLELFHVEILQALSLSKKRQSPRTIENFPEVVQTAINIVKENISAYRKFIATQSNGSEAGSERNFVIGLVRLWTLSVRGPSHFFQTVESVSAIAVQIDHSFEHVFGCSATSALLLVQKIIGLIDERLNRYLQSSRWVVEKTPRRMFDAFVKENPEIDLDSLSKEFLEIPLNRNQAPALLMNKSEELACRIFTFSFDDVSPNKDYDEYLHAILNEMSIAFEDLSLKKLEHIHLDNPVWAKPLIKIDRNTFFCCSSAILTAHLGEILEKLCGSTDKLKEKYEEARAIWLEKKLGDLVTKFFPHSQVYRKVTWIDPADQKTWESDLLMVIDKTVVIFEAKSGKIHAPAKRGGDNSLKKDIKKLLVDPSEQSERLAKYIKNANGVITLESSNGDFSIDSSKVRDLLRFNILLEPIGPLSAHWPRLRSAGFLDHSIDIAPSMSIFELETVCEVLTLEIERCHYLSRRSQFERNARYIADELDLLAFYIDNQFNLGDSEYDETEFMLYGMSDKISIGYFEKRSAGKLEFPIKRTKLWADLLLTVEKHAHEGWTRFGYRLLSVDYQAQMRFQKEVAKAWKEIQKHPMRVPSGGVITGNSRKKGQVCYGISKHCTMEQFRVFLAYACDGAFDRSDLPDLLMIWWFSPKGDEAYDFIGVMKNALRSAT